MPSHDLAFNLTGRTVAITGAAGGIGSATARLCVTQGARVVLGDLEAPKALADEMGGVAHALDVTDRASVDAFASAAAPADALIDCAAICPPDPWDGEDFDAVFDKVMAINARGPMMLARAFMPILARRGGGRIALIGSIAGRIGGVRSQPHYVMSKGGVHSLVRWLAKQGRGDGILVNAVAPAPVDTDMIRPLGLDAADTALGRYARAEEVAGPLVFLISPAASYISGAVLDINGGMHFT